MIPQQNYPTPQHESRMFTKENPDRKKRVVLFPEISWVVFFITYPPHIVKCISEYIFV